MARPRNQDTAEGRKRHEEKYQRILNAAMTVFAQNGFDEAKISQIAAAADVADGTIYLYFRNKDDLLISLFEAKLHEINAGLRDELQGVVGPQNRLRRIIFYHIELALENPALTAFITIELRRSGKFMKEYAKEQLAEYLSQWGDVIDEGKATGEFRSDVSTGMTKNLMFGALDHACGIWVNNPKRHKEDLLEVARNLYAFVLKALSAEPQTSDTHL